MSDKPDDAAAVARDLERIRAEVRERSLQEPVSTALPPPRPVPSMGTPVPATQPGPPTHTPPARPDPKDVNALWRADVAGGRPGFVRRIFDRLLQPSREAQTAWNAHQVRFDNELLAYVDGRFHATHLQYDAVLGIHAKHMQEIDERHIILQEELVAHVHDLVKRIDLVLSLSERESLGLESSLRDLRQRLVALENSPPQPRG